MLINHGVQMPMMNGVSLIINGVMSILHVKTLKKRNTFKEASTRINLTGGSAMKIMMRLRL